MKIESENRFLNSITLPNYAFIINSPEFKKEGEEFTIWFFENIIEKNPNYVDCLMYLGNAYTANGMYEKGLMVDQKLSRLRPKDPMVHYNLACSYALLKKIDTAFDALEKAITLGYKDVYHLEMDKDLAYLREDIRYRKLIEKIKNH
ncbi:MAG TPA: TPR end-of-group domain-containing protein [Candidatus Brocadiaceae bacterium]